MSRNVTLSVELPPDDSSHVARVYEVLARAAAGLLLEGIESGIYTYVHDEDDGNELL